MQRFLYQIEVAEDRRGWHVRLTGVALVWTAGPFATVDGAHAAVHDVVRRWQARARALGGFVWRPRGDQIGVALPAGIPVRAGLPYLHAPCSVVGGTRVPPR